MGDANAIPVLLYLFRRFERSLNGQPAMLSLDEAWVMLGHPVFREKLREWLKELRKKKLPRHHGHAKPVGCGQVRAALM
ncbi:hypothetical protein [Escherichia coli]|uniref:hypothetical protein n=1 Tax=Escherichia coli TaxID=562 RepID=UPI00388DFD3A